jgi:hypothetical protein
MNCLGSLKRKILLTQCGSRTLEPALAAMLHNVKTISDAEGRGPFQGNKKATEINASSPFSLCSLNGSDGIRTRLVKLFSSQISPQSTRRLSGLQALPDFRVVTLYWSAPEELLQFFGLEGSAPVRECSIM